MMTNPSNKSSRAVVKKADFENLSTAGQYYALIIGVAEYKYHNSLTFPVKDARRFERTLTNYYRFPSKNIHFLENPNRSDILDALDTLETILQPNDSLLIFYAGHGYWDERRNRGFWLPKDARIRARSAWISNATLQDYLMAYVCQHVLVISDSCFSGALLMNRSAMEEASKDIQVLFGSKSRRAITSGVKEEVPDRSVFFKELVTFLRKNQRPFLSAAELYAAIRNKVIASSSLNQKPQFGVIDQTGDEGGDFIFIRKSQLTQLTIQKASPFDTLMADERIKTRLTALRKQLDRDIPAKTLTGNLLVASWNIHKLGDTKNDRLEESIAYIATIISRFDVVAIQEIYGNFKVLDDISFYLGEHWDYVFSDTSIGLGGTDYRLGYFFDKRKVVQGGMTSDLILPSIQSHDENGHFVFKPAVQLLRPPFNCGFKLENSRFILCNIHLVFGNRQTKAERLTELQNVLNFWKRRTSINTVWSKNVILLGNLQTAKLSAKELHMVKESVFTQIDALKIPSNYSKTRHYNQMAFHLMEDGLQLPVRGGAFDFFESVFRVEDIEAYKDKIDSMRFTDMNGITRTFTSAAFFYKTFWRMSQMSNNLPLWSEIKVAYNE
ncbi:MAG: caspase family protein [Bacteroidota bacterium]